MSRLQLAVGAFLWVLACGLSHGQDRKPPPPPPLDVPALGQAPNPFPACIGCPKPFDFANHKLVLQDLASNAYIAELRRALYWQDTYHQFESRAHFDNCDFDGANAYLDQLLAEVDGHVDSARQSKAKGDAGGAEASMRKAFFALGQALHAVQDFFAHSDYVERTKDTVKREADLPVLAPWRAADRTKLKAMRADGLVSGRVWWGEPKHCPGDSLSHEALAKDNAGTRSGSVKVPHFRNRTQHEVAVFLAREASVLLMQDAFRRWPLMKEMNGSNVAFEVFIDRREHRQ